MREHGYTAEEIARVCHEANRALQLIQGDPGVPPAAPWDQFDDRGGVISGVEYALEGATPEELHEEWTRLKFLAGWTHGPVKDTTARTHPCLVPYDELPEHQRDKDDLFSAIVSALGDSPRTPAPTDAQRHHAFAVVHEADRVHRAQVYLDGVPMKRVTAYTVDGAVDSLHQVAVTFLTDNATVTRH